jgi:hypothetical protein
VVRGLANQQSKIDNQQRFDKSKITNQQSKAMRKIMTNGDAGFPVIQQLRRRIQQEYKWDALESPVARGYGPN